MNWRCYILSSLHIFDYCIKLFSCLIKVSINHFQSVQKATARLLAPINHHTLSHNALHWLNVKLRCHFKILFFTFIAFLGWGTTYIIELLHPSTTSRTLSSSDMGLMIHTWFKLCTNKYPKSLMNFIKEQCINIPSQPCERKSYKKEKKK